MIDRYTRKASFAQFRILGYDQYDYNDYFINEFTDLDQALDLLKIKCSTANATPTSFSDIFFIYDDKEEALYKASFDDGIQKL